MKADSFLRSKVPTPPSWRKMAHVGVGLLALSMGAGELYAWPRLVSITGGGVAWLLLPAALLQLPLLIECQRLAVMSGQSLIPLLSNHNRLVASAVFLGFIFAFLWLGGWIGGSAYGIYLLTGFPSWSQSAATLFWSIVLMLIFLVPLILGRETVFVYVNRTLTFFAVTAFVLCLVVVLIEPVVLSKLPEFLKASFTPSLTGWTNVDGSEKSDMVTAIMFMGMGGFACRMYTNLSMLARYGMAGAKGNDGAFLIRHVSGFRGQHEVTENRGVIAEGTDEDRSRFRLWVRRMWIESSAGVLGNWFTTFLLSLLAFALLFGSDSAPGRNWDLLSAQSRFFEPILGNFAFPLFVILACAFLLDTWIGFGVLWSQMCAESTCALAGPKRNWNQQTWFRIWIGVLVGMSILTLSVQSPGNLIRLTAICQMIAMPVLAGLLAWVNYFYLPRIGPRFYRPRTSGLVFLIVSAVAYIGLILWFFQ